MLLRSGNRFTISQEILSEVSHFEHHLCKVDDILGTTHKTKIISVGDVTTLNLHRAGVKPFIEVVDLKTKRGMEHQFESIPGSFQVSNPPGTLAHDLFLLLEKLMKSGGRVEVEGEEDLAVIPIIYYSDLNTLVVYGIPDKGMACIAVDADIKSRINDLVKRIENAGIEN